MKEAATSSDPADHMGSRDRLRQHFEHFAHHHCAAEPLYEALSRSAASEPEVLALLDAAPAEQRIPNLLFAAIHDLVLAGTGHPLSAYYLSVGGHLAADAGLHDCFVDFCRAEREALLERIATRTTQTNEIGRCAVLWPVLRLAAARLGQRELTLLDFGCSAGLNLGVDRYRYDYGHFTLSPGDDDAPQIDCRLEGTGKPDRQLPSPRIASRLGIDPAPMDLDDADAVRWLQACLWPSDVERRRRFVSAVAIARQQRWPVRREADCSSAVEPWITSLSSGVLPVVFNSWVLFYFDEAARRRHVERMLHLVQRHGIAWISAEAPELHIDGAEPPPSADGADADHRAGTLWTLVLPGREGPVAQVVARSHPHGRWMQWWA